MQPDSDSAEDLLTFGWQIAAATLANAAAEHTLVTHWFLTAEDDSVNADEHFGSDDRTLRFVNVALPTLIDQLAATQAVVALPWGVEGTEPTLTVIALGPGQPAVAATRALLRLEAEPGPPFWDLASGLEAPPSRLAAAVSLLAL